MSKKLLLSSATFLLITGNLFAQIIGAISLTTSVTAASSCTPPCDGTANVKATGGTPPYTYNWSTSPTQTTATATGLCPGTYSVVVTDANPSIPNYAAATVTITCGSTSGNTLAVTTSSIPASVCTAPCDGAASANVTGGQPPYTYFWGTNPTQTTQNATGLCPGTYTVMVRDATSPTPNQAVASVTVTCSGISTGSLTVGTTMTPASVCVAPCNGAATASAAGGTPPYTYTWSTAPVQTGPNATGLCPGVYTVSVTDAASPTPNQGMATVTVTCSNISTGTLTVGTSVTPATACTAPCNGTATANVTGGVPPYFYSWGTTPVQTTQTATGLCPGAYSVTITDSNTPTPNTAKGNAVIICNVANAVSGISLDESIHLFPNPAHSSLTVQFSSAVQGRIRVVIRGILGTEISREVIEVKNSASHTMDISGLPNGAYYVEFLTESSVISKQFIKQ